MAITTRLCYHGEHGRERYSPTQYDKGTPNWPRLLVQRRALCEKTRPGVDEKTRPGVGREDEA
eukprot:3939386-Rhodomonas_salina.2